MFEARDFAIRDGDTVYVTAAPISQWNNAISALTGSLSSTVGLANTITAWAAARLRWPGTGPRFRGSPARTPISKTTRRPRPAARAYHFNAGFLTQAPCAAS
jgi:hypothetical protein